MQSQECLMIHGSASYAGSIGQRCDTICIRAGDNQYLVMVDCGMEFVREEEIDGMGPSPDLALLNGEKIDAAVMTHSHVDHVGSLAWIVKQGYLKPEAKIFTSPQTAAIIPFVLQDGLQQKPRLYNIFDAVHVLKRLTIFSQPGEYELLPGLEVFVPQRGHIPGACGIVIPTASGKKGFITGDWCPQDQPVTKGALLPSKVWPAKWIPDEIWGTDLTYGAGAKKPLREEVTRLIAQTKIALSQGKKVVIAAFGNGRGQNVAIWLAKAGIPTYLDGVIRNIYQVFQQTRWSDRDGKLPKLGEKTGIHLVRSVEHREELISNPNPCVIVTTGGMGDFGPIRSYLEAGLERSDWAFFFTSWLAPGTTGQRLVGLASKREESEAPWSFRFGLRTQDGAGKMLKFVAQIDRFSLSAHGDLDDFIALIKDIVACRGGRPLDRIVLTHGTPETKAHVAMLLAPFSKEIIYGERNTVISLAA